jgi:hypothetical protein
MAVCSGRGVAVLVLLLSLLVAFARPCTAGRVLLAVHDGPRAPPHVEDDGQGGSSSSKAAAASGGRGSPAAVSSGTTADNAAARVLGSVPSPGVGH